MQHPQLAVILDGSAENRQRLGVILDLLGIAWRSYASVSQMEGAEQDGEPYAILAPVTAMNELRASDGSSTFFYGTKEISEDRYPLLAGNAVNAVVSKDLPAFTGPMHGLIANVRVRFGDCVAVLSSGDSVIIDTDRGPAFFCREHGRSRSFVSCSPEIPDLGEPADGKGYDVRKHFLSAVPLLLYLRWAFRATCWQPSEPGACWIIDDPPLRTKYGFCDFRLLDAQMKENSFSTNVAMIPWNARRASSAMASLVKSSQGRLSVSVHGCDHTAGEFGSEDADELCAKTQSAQQQMEQLRRMTGVEHDAVMIFPQGIFSRESLRTLQQHQFAAAVNTEVWPLQRDGEKLTVADTWRVAILKYGSFPIFTRRYPTDGLANFAFDLLLGKPCLVVEHQGFFKGDHAEVVRFARALNSLNANLHWRGLGDVIRGSFQWRSASDGVMQVRMFANELVLKNGENDECTYRIEKSDEGSVGVQEVTANGRALEWHTDGYTISFICQVPSGAEVLLRVRYTPSEKAVENMHSIGSTMKVAGRRYLSEFRDNFLSRHSRLMAIAQRARRIAGGAK